MAQAILAQAILVQAIVLRGLTGISNLLQAPCVHVMKAKRLASCLGYAWRIANQFGDPCVVGYLFYALQALQHRQSPAVPVVNNCKATPISLFDTLIPEPNRWSRQHSQVRTVSTTKTANAVVQTEPEVQVQPLAKDIGQIVQMQVEMQIKPLLQLLTDTQEEMQKREEAIASLEKRLSNRSTAGSNSSQQPALLTPDSRISRAPDACSDVVTVESPTPAMMNQGETSQPVGLFREDQDSAKSAESHVEAKRRRREARKLELEAAILANQYNPI